MELKKICVVMILIIVSLLIISCNSTDKIDYEDSNIIREEINKLVESYREYPSTEVLIDFELITDFDWDTLYLVSPYSVLNEFCDSEKIHYNSSIKTSISTDDGIILILFVKESEVVSYLNYPRNEGDFSNLSKKKFKYLKDESKFTLTAIDNWIQFTQ